MDSLETQFNEALHYQLPANVINHRHKLAIDLHLIPYYGHPSCEEPRISIGLRQGQGLRFFAYATIYLICLHHRLALAIHPVRQDETLVATITHLLLHLTPLEVEILSLFLD